MSTVLILGIIIIIIFIFYMKTDFFNSEDSEKKDKNSSIKKSKILDEDKSEDDILTMKKINKEIRKLSEAIISDERSLKRYIKSSDRRSMSEISYDQSSEIDTNSKKNKNRGNKMINKSVIKLERITEKNEDEDEEEEKKEEEANKEVKINEVKNDTISKTSEGNKIQLYNEFKKFLLEKKKEESIEKMHKLASELKNKLNIDENTKINQNFIPNYDLSDTISGIINNELKNN